MIWLKESNLKAYDRTEQLNNYSNIEDLKKYRMQRLEESEKNIALIDKYLKNKINVLELCSGNSRLLYALSIKERLNHGIGVEISKNRHIFAEKWREELKIDNRIIKNVNQDVLKYNPSRKDMDLVICLDGSFNFLYPVDKKGHNKVLKRAANSLKKGGFVIIEFITRKKIIKLCKINNGVFKSWEEFPDTDPFIYLLSNYRYIPEENLVEHNEVFIRRDGYIDRSKCYRLKIYTLKEIKSLMGENDLQVIDIYDSWDFDKNIADSNITICVGRKI